MLQLDVPESSGRLYPTSVIQKAIDALKDKNENYKLGVVETPTYSPTINESVGVLENLAIEDGFLTGEVIAIEDRMNKFSGVTVVLRPLIIGESDEKGVIKEGCLIVGALILTGPLHSKN